MYNIRDWCISRQLWWGHRIPAWHCQECHETVVARETPSICPRCGSAELVQDTDVLDTWFSSALLAVLHARLARKDLGSGHLLPHVAAHHRLRHPVFWVARMIMMGLEFMGEAPFHQVYIHALVRDARARRCQDQGQRHRPLVVTEKYGTDAIRMAMLQCAAPGTDIVLTEARMESSRAFCQ